MAGFLIRLVVYAAILGVTSRIAQALWSARGLDGVDAVVPLHDAGLTVLLFAPLVLAFFGGPLRRLGVFAAGVLAGGALTAPFAFARLVIGG